MFKLVVLLALILMAGTANAFSKDCMTTSEAQKIATSKDSKPLPANSFKGINKRWNVQRILKHLGPAARDIGSGLHILEWDIDDGRVFSVSTGTLCGKPMKVGFLPGASKRINAVIMCRVLILGKHAGCV